MRFATVVEVKLRERGNAGQEVRTYVSKAEDEEVIVGPNILPLLGYHLVRRESRPEGAVSHEEARREESAETKMPASVASVMRRAYVAPGTVGWIPSKGCTANADIMLDSTTEKILSGGCHPKMRGCVKVPVANRSSKPYVFRENEKVENWISDPKNWEHAMHTCTHRSAESGRRKITTRSQNVQAAAVPD